MCSRSEHFLFTIENPYTGKLKEHGMVKDKLEASRANGGLGATRCVVDYCWFWDGGDAFNPKPFNKRTSSRTGIEPAAPPALCFSC